MDHQNNMGEIRANEEKKQKSSYSGIVWLIAILLLLLLLLSTALVFCILWGFTLQEEETPRIEIDIAINVGLPSGEGSPWDTDTYPVETTTGDITPPETTTDVIIPPETTTVDTTATEPIETPEFTIPTETERYENPNVNADDKDGYWSDSTVVEIFRAVYENDAGAYTVRSAYGDKVIAPGTANKYYFDIKNTGNVGVDYIVKVFAEITSSVNEESFLVPLEVRFYRQDGEYMLGSEDDYASMYDIDGLEQCGELGRKRYVRYVLDWQWPFEGNDELDTLLGNLSAEGGEIRVALRLQVSASMNNLAHGGTLLGQ